MRPLDRSLQTRTTLCTLCTLCILNHITSPSDPKQLRAYSVRVEVQIAGVKPVENNASSTGPSPVVPRIQSRRRLSETRERQYSM